MNLLNLFKAKYTILILCFSFLLNAQYFQSIEKSLIGCWKLEDSEIKEYLLFLKDGIVFEKSEWGNETKVWKISRDSLITEQNTYKNIGGYLLGLDDKVFAIISVSKKKIVLMDLDMATVTLHFKKVKCRFCKDKPYVD